MRWHRSTDLTDNKLTENMTTKIEITPAMRAFNYHVEFCDCILSGHGFYDMTLRHMIRALNALNYPATSDLLKIRSQEVGYTFPANGQG